MKNYIHKELYTIDATHASITDMTSLALASTQTSVPPGVAASRWRCSVGSLPALRNTGMVMFFPVSFSPIRLCLKGFLLYQ